MEKLDVKPEALNAEGEKPLDIYTKIKVKRLIGQGKELEIQQSPFEVLSQPFGVRASDLLRVHTISIKHLLKEAEETNNLLRSILRMTSEEPSNGSENQ
jgi:hypothetical protein